MVQSSESAATAVGRFDVLGVPVSAINLDAAIAAIDRWIDDRTRTYVCITGAHGVVECRSDEELRRIHQEAGLVTPDGMPLVWIARMRGLSDVGRVYGPDLMRALCGRSARPERRHFYFGGAEGVAERLVGRLRAFNPALNVVGTITPPFGPMSEAEDEAVIRQINDARPDILWVGLSTPKQERWMSRHRERLAVPVMVGVGAAFDFVSGEKRQAPVWMGRNGLEWLFRLLSEPARLGRRYLRIVPAFGLVLIGEAFRRLTQRRDSIH